jgi:hypothetical protein
MTSNVRIIAALSLLFFALLFPSCGGGSSSTPTTPTTPTTPSVDLSTVNITGTWKTTSSDGTAMWTLTQNGATVTGTSVATGSSGAALAYYGPGVRGTVSGTMAGGVFTYLDSYTTLIIAGCTETNSGQLTLQSATAMTGRNSEQNTCKQANANGVTASGVVTFTKQ